ncbi:MAG: HAD-IA family hydrolase [Candidatus Micrarchaeaceae archaeon]
MGVENYDLYIFDWDGTLTKGKFINKLNEKLNPFWKRWKKASKYGKINKEKKIIADTEIFEKNEEKYSLFLDLFVFIYKPKLQKYSRNTLELLKKRGKKVALFSNGAKWRIRRELTHIKISKYFDIIVSAQDIGILKPNPYGLNIIAKLLSINRSRILYVGDMVDDIITARAAKIDCCAISDGFDTYEMLKAENPQYLFKTMEEFYLNLNSA